MDSSLATPAPMFARTLVKACELTSDHGRRSDDWPAIIQLDKLRKEAEAASSLRAQDLSSLVKALRTCLGLQHDDTSHTTGSGSQRQTVQNPLESSDFQKLRVITAIMHNLASFVKKTTTELRMLEALCYDSIYAREDSIQTPVGTTFEWILQDHDKESKSPAKSEVRHQLHLWLREGHGIFHISGPPGTGKSTLLKFIAHHPRTKTELQEWAAGKELIIVPFYFWSAGAATQHSMSNYWLQRSVLVQILKLIPECTQTLFAESWDRLLEAQARGVHPPDSSVIKDEDVVRAWNEVQYAELSSFCVCLFINGLDELKESTAYKYSNLAEYIQEMANVNEGFKICATSRPLEEFVIKMGSDHKVDLSDLIYNDIRTCASSTLLDLTKTDTLTSVGEDLVNNIVQKSKGSFSWLHTVLATIAASSHGIVWSEIPANSRIATLAGLVGSDILAYPSDMNDLYKHVLGGLTAYEQSQAAEIFTTIFWSSFPHPPNALWIPWLESLKLDAMFPGAPSSDAYTADKIRDLVKASRLKVGKLTKGLVSMHADRLEPEEGDQFYRWRVQFSQRTARDFICSARGKQFLTEYRHSNSRPSTQTLDGPPSERSTGETLCRLRLAEVVLAGKYPVASGTSPRRRRQYFEYAHSMCRILDWGAPGWLYMVPTEFMETLRRDLETTNREEYGSAYAVSRFRGISPSGGASFEHPGAPASFLHLALAWGQQAYVFDCLADEAKREAALTSADPTELDFITTTVLGGPQTAHIVNMSRLIRHGCDVLRYISVRPSVGEDFPSKVPQMASVTMVLAITSFLTVFGTFGTFRESDDPSSASLGAQLKIISRLLVESLEQPGKVDKSPLDFVFLLKKIEEPLNPPPTEVKPRKIRTKRLPEGLHEWITPPAKGLDGKFLNPQLAEMQIAEANKDIHPCGVVVKSAETHYTTLKAIILTYLKDIDLLAKITRLVPNNISKKVLNERSDFFHNQELKAGELEGHECTRAVASNGVIIGEDELHVRIF